MDPIRVHLDGKGDWLDVWPDLKQTHPNTNLVKAYHGLVKEVAYLRKRNIDIGNDPTVNFRITLEDGRIVIAKMSIAAFTNCASIIISQFELEEDINSTPFACIGCDGTSFLEGPHGGLAVNFCCATCGMRYNDAIGWIDSVPADGDEREWFKGEYTPTRGVETRFPFDPTD